MKEERISGYSILSETVTLVCGPADVKTNAFQLRPFRVGTEYISVYALVPTASDKGITVTLLASKSYSNFYADVGVIPITVPQSDTVGYASIDLRLYPAFWYKLMAVIPSDAKDDDGKVLTLSIFRNSY